MSVHSLSKSRTGVRDRAIFLLTFLVAWGVLDRLVTAPPLPLSALASLAVATVVLTIGQLASGVPWRAVPASLGLGRPAMPAVALAGLVGGVFIAAVLLASAAAGVNLTLRANWPAVLVGVLLFHGMAEELVWRGFVFCRLRQSHSFATAVWLSVPLIALTHVPIVITNGWLVGGLATLTAATTCWPFASLWERGGRTIWAPALLHAAIGTWQLFDRTYSAIFSVIVLLASITIPLVAYLVWNRFPVQGTRSGRDIAGPSGSRVSDTSR